MKPEGRVEIIILQPMALIQTLGNKQIEAYCERVGIEDILTKILSKQMKKIIIFYFHQRIEIRKEVKKTKISSNTYKKKK